MQEVLWVIGFNTIGRMVGSSRRWQHDHIGWSTDMRIVIHGIKTRFLNMEIFRINNAIFVEIIGGGKQNINRVVLPKHKSVRMKICD